MSLRAPGARRSILPNKKRRASRSSRSGTPETAAQPQSSGPVVTPRAMLNALRLIGLMAATAVALLVYELLAGTINFWWALVIGMVAGIVARALFLWLERVWLRAVARRAERARQTRAK